MPSLDQLISSTNLNQDLELASAIATLKKDPQQLQQFLQSQQDHVYKDIVKQKEGTFQKVYGDLNRASKVQESILMYDQRNKELSNMQQQIYDNQKNNADTITQDKSMAGRKHEMNEWTVNNKKDTLFVFSSLFIMLSGLLLITVLWRMGMIGAGLWVALGAPMIIIFIMIVVRRSQYTDILRNKRYWNKQIFEGKYGKIPLPSCPGLTESVANLGDNAQKTFQDGLANIEGGLSSALSSGGKALTEAGQSVRSSTQ